MADRRIMPQYNYDNTARQQMPARQVEPARRERRQLHVVEEASRSIAINNKKRQKANAIYTLGMIAALMVVFLVCVDYLALQSEVSEKASIAARLEQKYTKLKSDNDFMEVYIDSNIDYDHILDVATNELGMVYAKSNQVVSYKSEAIEYVKQFAEIPK